MEQLSCAPTALNKKLVEAERAVDAAFTEFEDDTRPLALCLRKLQASFRENRVQA